ncbi:MAG: hypothetical protein KKF44_10335 [Nanoarchaeota archaeon]|nr:hypothetical protein [Nanoarchaeota archaeon]
MRYSRILGEFAAKVKKDTKQEKIKAPSTEKYYALDIDKIISDKKNFLLKNSIPIILLLISLNIAVYFGYSGGNGFEFGNFIKPFLFCIAVSSLISIGDIIAKKVWKLHFHLHGRLLLLVRIALLGFAMLGILILAVVAFYLVMVLIGSFIIIFFIVYVLMDTISDFKGKKE